MDIERLVAMANQVADFFAAQRDGAEAAIAAHIEAFWEPRMRAAMAEHVARGGAGLSPLALSALSGRTSDAA